MLTCEYSLRIPKSPVTGKYRPEIYAVAMKPMDDEIIGIAGPISKVTQEMVFDGRISPEVMAEMLVRDSGYNGKKIVWANSEFWSVPLVSPRS